MVLAEPSWGWTQNEKEIILTYSVLQPSALAHIQALTACFLVFITFLLIPKVYKSQKFTISKLLHSARVKRLFTFYKERQQKDQHCTQERKGTVNDI